MISVCMATYNGEKFIVEQLQSIIKQLSEQDEIIIVDDCSTDRTVSLIQEVSSKYSVPVKILENPQNRGPIASFERAMSVSRGAIIFFSDQDDIWFFDKVKQVQEIFQDPEVSLVVHDGVIIDQENQELEVSWNDYNNNHLSQGILGNVVKNGFTGCMMALRRNLLEAVLPFPKTIEMHDQWIALVAKKEHMKIAIVDAPLIYYRRHGNNVTGMKKRTYKEKIFGRLNMIKCIIKYKRKNGGNS